jgi:hypothetical protein
VVLLPAARGCESGAVARAELACVVATQRAQKGAKSAKSQTFDFL